jgi:hypothetical protein
VLRVALTGLLVLWVVSLARLVTARRAPAVIRVRAIQRPRAA